MDDPRLTLDRLIRDNGHDYAAVSRLLRRNSAYIQQYIKRGTPKKLDEDDRRLLAEFFGVDEVVLGGQSMSDTAQGSSTISKSGGSVLRRIAKLSVGASAGPGALTDMETAIDEMAFGEKWLRRLCGDPAKLSLIAVEGDSMAPTLNDGDDIMVDRAAATAPLREGIYVLRMDDVLMVKRLAVAPDRSISIISDNPQFRDWDGVDPANIDVIGRVVWTGRKL